MSENNLHYFPKPFNFYDFFSSLGKKKLMEKAVLILLMKPSVISKHFEKEKNLG